MTDHMELLRLLEQASEQGAARALTHLGLADESAGKDMADLRELLSAWRDAIEGVRYRLAGPTSSVFLPADAQMVVVPLRAVGPTAEVRVELRLDGRPADVVVIPSERWQYLRLTLPRDSEGPRFRRLDLLVPSGGDPSSSPNTPQGDGGVLMIGKVEAK